MFPFSGNFTMQYRATHLLDGDSLGRSHERINTKGGNSYTDSFRVADLQFVHPCELWLLSLVFFMSE